MPALFASSAYGWRRDAHHLLRQKAGNLAPLRVVERVVYLEPQAAQLPFLGQRRCCFGLDFPVQVTQLGIRLGQQLLRSFLQGFAATDPLTQYGARLRFYLSP